MKLANDLAYKAAISVAKAVGHHLLSRQAAGQVEIYFAVLNVLCAMVGVNRDSREQADAFQRLGKLNVLFQLAEIGSILQNVLFANINSTVIFILGALVVYIGNCFVLQIPNYAGFGRLFYALQSCVPPW